MPRISSSKWKTRRSVGDRQSSAQTSHRRCNVMYTELDYIDLGCGHSLEAKKPRGFYFGSSPSGIVLDCFILCIKILQRQ